MAIARLDTEGKWMVGTSPIYVPATPCKVEHSNITASSTGRDESGMMHIDWLRRDVRKVFLTYGALSASELAYMMNLMQGKEFVFTFYDQGTVKTMNAYVGESSYEFLSYSGSEPIYVNFSINVIEM
jgi:hypothetical protein